MNHQPYGMADGRVYTGNLRNAKARDIYIGSGAEAAGAEWEPTFTQHGFRYLLRGIYMSSKSFNLP
jgi:hypothetical protein